MSLIYFGQLKILPMESHYSNSRLKSLLAVGFVGPRLLRKLVLVQFGMRPVSQQRMRFSKSTFLKQFRALSKKSYHVSWTRHDFNACIYILLTSTWNLRNEIAYFRSFSTSKAPRLKTSNHFGALRLKSIVEIYVHIFIFPRHDYQWISFAHRFLTD